MNPTSPHLVKITLVLTLLFSAGNGFSQIIYVSTAGDDINSGDSWAQAYRTLTHAIDQAGPGDDIWVAQGTYYPVECDPCSASDREQSFDMPNMVRIYGGFDGTETSLSERDWVTNETILSGDINEDGTLSGNSYTVVNINGISDFFEIDGFTVTGGNAEGVGLAEVNGGAIYTTGSSDVILRNLRIEESQANSNGGGIFVGTSEISIEGSFIENNFAVQDGGGMYFGSGTAVVVSDCEIRDNIAEGDGGGGYFGWISSGFTVIDSRFEGNQAENGGGVFTDGASDISGFENTDFVGNTASDFGGGVFNTGSDIYFLNCVIKANIAENERGGGFHNSDSDVLIENCKILGNSAENSSGGGINNRASDAIIIGCLISGNLSNTGGGVYNLDGAQPSIINSTITGNRATGLGGAILNTIAPNFTIENCIIWNNMSGSGNSLEESVYFSIDEPLISHSIVQASGGSGDWDDSYGIDGENNLDLNPRFFDEIDPINAPDTTFGIFWLTECSPAIDAGNPDTTGLNLPEEDLDGNPRVFNATSTAEAIVDMGAFEFSSPIASTGIWYVNQSVSESGNGVSWDCPFDDLQDALAAAEEGDEIWVAAGTYFPTSNTTDRDAKFVMKRGVSLYGGFDGTEENRNERDWNTNETILSGDINDTGLDDGNSYNVIDASCYTGGDIEFCVDETTVIDGFTVTMGYADGSGDDRAGAGLLSIYGEPTIRNCIFRDNFADLGGAAMYNYSGKLLIQNSLFYDNEGNTGSVIYLSGPTATYDGAEVTIINSTFANNTPTSSAAIFFVNESTVEVENSIFWNNGSTNLSWTIPTDAPQVSYSIVEQSSSVFPGTGNLNTNPLFENVDARNYNLTDCSPAIDAGNPDTTGLALPEFDLGGNPRLFNATGIASEIIDMGAYEFQDAVATTSGNPNTIYVNAQNQDPGNGLSWDCAFSDLQDALEVAQEGDTIWVAAGTYKPSAWPEGCSNCSTDRHFTFQLRNGVSVYGGFDGTESDLSERDIATNTTTLSGDIGTPGDISDNVLHVVLAAFPSTAYTSHLDGFTIRGGNANTPDTLLLNGDRVFSRSGGGIYLREGTNTIVNNRIIECMATSNGSGIYTWYGNNTITGNVVAGNSANRGGGIYSFQSVNTFFNNVILGNQALNNGGGIYSNQGLSTIYNNSISGNQANNDGGGIYLFEDPGTLANNIVWGNSDGIIDDGSNATVSFSIVQGGFAGTGILDLNPLFVDQPGIGLDTIGDLRLEACSPAIDAGDNSALGASDTLDFDGNPRFFDATGQGVATVDMGAYEFQGTAATNGNPNTIYVNEQNLDPGSGLNWDCAFSDLQDALAVAQEGDTIWVAAGTYWPTSGTDRSISFQLKTGVELYGGFDGTETELSQRDPEANETILSGFIGNPTDTADNSFHVIMADDISEAVLDGFTVTGGNSSGSGAQQRGGGLFVTNSILELSNILFTDNHTLNGGGAIYSTSSELSVKNSTFLENSSLWDGAAIFTTSESELIIDSTIFESNTGVFGGAISTQGQSISEIYNTDFINNFATDFGGALLVQVGDTEVTLNNCTFTGNETDGSGGGIAVLNSGVVDIHESVFDGNSSDDIGGAIVYGSSSSGSVLNCEFWNNSAENGGGIGVYIDAVIIISNSDFRANQANTGSAIRINSASSTVVNSVFSGNFASAQHGGAIYNYSSNPTIINSTFSGNQIDSALPGMDQGAAISNLNSDPTITNCIIWGNSSGIRNENSNPIVSNSIFQDNVSGSNVFSANPLFVDMPDFENAPTTAGEMQLQACSPAIDAGDNSALGATDSLDLDGSPRFFDATGQGVATVDLGAYEFQDTAATGGNPGTIYVNIQNQVPGSGLSWDCAFSDLQDALAVAQEGDTIWVAQGSYSPADDSDPEVSFELISGVVILGGFDGTETSADQRDWENNLTILDGNIASGPNTYTVVYADNVDSTTVLDGFTIQGGFNTNFPTAIGGGIYINFGAPVIRNCTIQNNFAFEGGGGVYMESSAPVFINTTFFDNSTSEGGYGGGAYAYFSDPHFEDCHFDQNFSFYGGGIYSEGSDVFIKDTEFSQQFATEFGGGILTDFSSQITIENSIFIHNEAGTGGAIAGDNSDVNISGSSFTENSAFFGSGGAISSLGPFANLNVNILNSTFSNNSSPENCGGAVSVAGPGAIMTIDSTDFLGNEAASGGAVCVMDAAQGTLNHVTFTENEAVKGGAIFASDAELLSINNGDFQENSSTEDGGSISSSASLNFSIDSSEFLLNAADSFGGAVFHEQDTLVLTNSFFNENTAHCGGAIYTSEGGLQVSFTDFEMNIAAFRGGAHCAVESKDDYNHVNFDKNEAAKGGAVYGDKTKSKFLHTKAKENKAQQKGGAYYKKEAEVEKKHSKIEENESESGGGIYSKKSEMTIDSSEIAKNMALEDGGGFCGDSSKTHIKNSKLKQNIGKKGGGMATKGCDVKVKDTEIKDNEAEEKGGGVYHEDTKKQYDGVNVQNNTAEQDGGGMKIKNAQDSSKLKNVNVRDNSSQEKGGGMATDSSKMEFENCNFAKNESEKGGNIYNKGSDCRYKNTKITGGKANKGGGMYNEKSSPKMINCQVTGNVARNQMNFQTNQTAARAMQSFLDGEGGGFFNEEGSPQLINLTISGNYADDSGGGMQNTDSSNLDVSNTIVHNNQSGDGQDTLNSNISNENSTPNFNNSVVEGSNGSDDWDPETGNDSGNNFDLDPQFVNDLDPSPEPSEGGNYRLTGGSGAIDSGNDDDVPEDVETDIIGNARTSLLGVDIGAYERQSCQFDATNTIFVDVNRTDSVGTGQSWETAFNELFDALFLALDCDSTFFIFIAEGSYYPTDDPTDREGAVILRNSLNILGGFPGEGSPDLADRDWREYPTTISGDINRSGDLEGNSYSVVAAFDADSSAVLDGLIIRDGNADGMNGSPLSPLRAGAGVYIIGSDPTLKNLIIKENTAETGAGMLITGAASPSLNQIEILNNTALETGGGLADVSFEGQDTSIWSNLLIAGNSAGENGGGLYLENQRGRIFMNATVSQNMAGENGSAVYNVNSLSHFRNSIIWDNQGSIFSLGSPLTSDFSLIQVPFGVYPGNGNLNVNPVFSDPDAGDFSITGCSPAINAGTSEFAPDIDLLDNVRPANSNIDMGAYEFQGSPEENCCPEGEIIYVDHQAQGVNNGSDWVNAFTDLQDALGLMCPEVTQLWIAEGTYYPTSDTMDRDSSFVIPSGISIYGGFQGDEESVEERNWYLNRTVLSGDINESGTLDGNSHTVVVIKDAQSEVSLDGLFITMGNADGFLGMVVGPHNAGGGLYIDNSSVVGRNLYVEGNTSVHSGAGISISESEVDLANTVVSANYSEFQGGGLYLDGQSEVSLVNSTFSGNISDNEGGAIYSQQGILSIFNSIIWNNSADSDSESLSASISDLGTGLSISHSIISGSGGSGPNWNPPVGSDEGGNLDIDPLFVEDVDFNAFPSPSGDLNLTSCSPALDRGLNAAVENLVSEDLSGDPRLFNSTDKDSAVVDMGAYEFQGPAEFPDLNCDDFAVFLDEDGEKELTDDQLVPDAQSCGTLGIDWTGLVNLHFDCTNTGTYTVSVVGTDSASLRMDSCHFELTVSDTTTPTVICDDTTIDLDANGVATLELGDFNYFASGNCAFDTLYVSNGEFNCSDVGTNIYEFVVTDINDNTTICTAEVEVVNPFSPEVDCRDTSIVLDDSDMVMIGAGDIGEVIESNCAIDSVWIDMNSFGCPEVGLNTVRFFALDITGKIDSCSSTVTVVDEIVTVVQCNNITVHLDSLGNASIEPEEVDDNSILSCGIIDSELDNSDFTCADVGEFPVVTILSFLDSDGVAGQCTSIVEVLDTIAPFAQCEDVTIEIEPGDAFVVLDPETLVGSASFDACGIDSSAVDKDTFFLQDLGENTVELTIQDPSGNASTCSAEVTVEGCPPFSLDCPVPDTIYVGSGCSITNLNYESATSNDSPCPLEFSQVPFWGQVLSPGVYTQIVSAEDPAGNTASCSFELTIKDTIPPTVSCPQDGVVYVDENCTALLEDFTGEADASDNCGISETVQMPAADYSLTADDTTEVTITVFDQSDNSATCSFSIVAVDTMSPTLQCDEDQIVRYVDGNCQAEVGDLTSLATPEDNCVTSFTTVQVVAADSIISAGDELLVTLAVSNVNGWTGSCEIPVVAVDTMQPQLTCLVDSDTVQVDTECNGNLEDYTGYAFVSDNCLAPGDFAVSQSPAVGTNLSPGDEFSVNLVASDNGLWEDSCQINIVVVDPFDPVLDCQTENIVREVGPNCLVEVGDLTSIAIVSDNCQTGDAFNIVQNIPQDSMITAGGSVNAMVSASHSTGWSAQCSVTVSAINESVFSWQDPLPMDDTLSCELEAEIVSLTVSDFCDTLSVYPTTDTTMGCMGIESLVFTWEFGDLNHSQTIVFVDETPPVWLTQPLPQNTTVECDQIPPPVTLEAEDICSEVNIDFEEEVLGDTIAGSYTLSRSWTAADDCGNEITHQQLLTVVDQTPPTISCPDTVVIDADNHCSVSLPDLSSYVTVDDNCSPIENISINQIPSPGLTVIVEEITVFAVAIDEAGNSINCSFTLAVENFGQDASIQCPEPIAVNAPEGDCDKFVEFEATFTEGCDGVEIVNDFNSGAENASGFYPLGTTEVSFVLSQNGQAADSCVSSVEVLDVEVPELTCPDDMIVDTDPDACNVTGFLPGEASVSSTCGSVQVSVDNPSSLEIGLNTIVHTAVAGNGQTAQCEQTVEVLDVNPPSIVCPDDVTVQVDSGQCVASEVETGDAIAISLCGEVDTESNAPEIFPVGTTIVTYTAAADNELEADCEQEVTITWMDAVEINCPNDITKVLTGGDCELEGLDLGTPVLSPLCGDISLETDAPGVFESGISVVTHTATLPNGTELTCEQEVEVIDNYPMSIDCPENLVFTTDPGICEVLNPDVGEAEVFTVCESVVVESDVPTALPPGTHTITFTASTGSGNEVSCEQTVEVQDNEAPIIECPDDKEVQILLGSSTAQVDLSPATAEDNCGIDQISNNWNSGGADASGIYPSGETTVMFTALDLNGNSATCVTLISVEIIDTSLYSISGNVSSWNNVGMSDVELVLSGGLSESHFTDDVGDYQFSVPGSTNLIVSPDKDISWPTGISVVDLVMAQRNILQIETFDNPYQIIAADVNGSGSNTTLDLVIMQSIILGITSAEPNISPTVFLPADYEFNDPQNPLSENWPEELAYQSISGDKEDQDFVAIKRGDVSGTAFSSIRLAPTNPLKLILDAESNVNEGEVEVVVSGSGENSIRGYQMEFNFDPGYLYFEGLDINGSMVPDMREDLFFVDQENGIVRAIWYNAESVDLSDEKQLFSLRFSKSDPSISVKDHFELITSPQSWKVFATGPDHPKIPIEFDWRKSEEGSVPGVIDVSPNPFRNLTVVNFEMPENQPVNIRVFDAAGAVIYDSRFDAVEGLNRYDLNLDGESSGAIYLLLETRDWNQVIKLLRID